MNKYRGRYLTAFLAVIFAACGQLWALSDAECQTLLKRAEDNTAFYETDFKGNYTVVQNKPGEGQNLTEAVMYRRDRTGAWTILVTGPAKEKAIFSLIIISGSLTPQTSVLPLQVQKINSRIQMPITQTLHLSIMQEIIQLKQPRKLLLVK